MNTMFAFLEGIVAYSEEDAIVLAVGGVGYRIATPRFGGKLGDTVRLHIAEIIREDKFDLYGFASRDDLHMFHKLIGIDGVGPKSALKIMSSGSVDDLRRNIHAGDIGFLTAISGVGKKTAQKIILELKGVLVTEEQHSANSDVEGALQSLGYSRGDLEHVLPYVVGETLEEKVKSALQMLGRR